MTSGMNTAQTSGNTGSGTTTFDSHVAGADSARRHALGEFLRRKRDAIPPGLVGIIPRSRRRCPGLLREEVAERAGVGVTWYTWLEQARNIRASSELIDRLGDALMLDAIERTHLHDLARPIHTRRGHAADNMEVSPALREWLDALVPCPAYALNPSWNVVAWNEAAAALFGNFANLAPVRRNIMWRLFLDPTWRSLFVDWDEVAASVVAQFRVQAARFPATPAIATLVASLKEQSQAFAALWSKHAVAAPQVWRKRFVHPQFGTLIMTYSALQAQGEDGDITVVIYAPGLPNAIEDHANSDGRRKARRP